ncbi:thioredoxin family protein [Bacillus thuringiensis]|uniref:thioredoxin family protein n=1 Tax=Bacillus thuringiensis TaxID=1428 RepID=UPI002A38590F|nr:thioredoxin family protein [Bacillus cereus]MDA2496762.1 thioredoxin family protein [Bacillus cereus]
MTKKVFLASLVIILSVCIVFFVSNSKSLDTPDYTNITMKELQKKIDSKDNFKVYVYKTSCSACQTMKPIMNEVIREEKIDILAFNIESESSIDFSFLEGQNIDKTPTLLQYKSGEEVARLEGLQSKQELKKFMKQ